MDFEQPIPEESGGECSNSNGCILQIIDQNQIDSDYYREFTSVLAEALNVINGDDGLFDPILADHEKLKDLGVRVIDAFYFRNAQAGHKFQAAVVNGQIVAVCMFLPIFKGDTCAVKFLYCTPEARGRKVSKKLTDSLGYKNIIFQTRKEAPPTDLLYLHKGKERMIIGESDKFINHYVRWEA